MHRDLFWAVTARLEWVRSALRQPQGRTEQVLSCLAEQVSWPACAYEGTLRPLTGQHPRYLGPDIMTGCSENKCSQENIAGAGEKGHGKEMDCLLVHLWVTFCVRQPCMWIKAVQVLKTKYCLRLRLW